MGTRHKYKEDTSEKMYRFYIADIIIEIHSPFKLFTGRGLMNYCCEDKDTEGCVRINVSRMEEVEKTGFMLRGTDMLLEYYSKENGGKTVWCCEAPGKFGPVTRALYTEDFKCVTYEINEKSYPRHITSADKILQLFPMRQFLFEKKIFLLHSSQAVIEGKGILFTGDSGVGKTTQAHLLEKFYQAEIVCNDRTAISKREGKWRTYGFPIDGSEPINRRGMWDLAAIIVLSQGNENHICRYSGIAAVKALIRQLMLDVWNPQMCAEIIQRLIIFLKDIPVYKMECTEDRRAADCLIDQMRKDEII